MTATKKNADGPLEAFLRKWQRLKVNSYEPHEVLHDIPLRIIFGPERPRRLILIAKEALVLRITHELGHFPKHWVVVQRKGMPGQPHVDELVSLSRRLDLPINFVGDLSPFYLHVFLNLSRLLGAGARSLRWSGISERWIGLCGQLAERNGFNASIAWCDMSPIERQHFAAVKAAAPWLKEALGAEPWNLLEQGRTMSLESASGLTAYGAGFRRKLVRLLDEETIGK